MMRMTGSFCVLCSTNIDASSCVNIFTPLLYNNELLVNFIIREFKQMSSNLHSPYICFRCYKLFQMLERAQWIINNVRCEILKSHQRILPKNTDYLVDNTQIFEAIQTKRDLDQTTNGPKHITDLSYLNYLNINPNLMASHNIKNIELIDSRDIFKEETDIDSKVSESVYNIIKNNSYCNIDYKNNDNVNKDTKIEIYNKKRDLIMQILENDFRKYMLNDIVERDITEQEISNKQCKFCTESFKTNEELNVHLLKHNDIQLYQCSECKEILISVSLASMHVLKAHSENQHCVNILPISYKNEIEPSLNDVSLFPQNNTGTLNDIKSNTFEHTEIDKNISEIRDNTMSTIENKEVAESNAINSIDEKSKVNSNSVSWKSRGILNYSLKPFKHTCSKCNKKWKTSTELKIHMKSHSNIRPYMCEICGQAYKYKQALNIHIDMHNGISPFQCSYCNKCFTQKGALVRHLPMHTGETPYQCELCGKRFIHHSSYNMHILSHTGKKSYQCHICDASLLSTSHLKRHMRVHTGEKPYSCIVCGKRFAQRYNLQSHKKIHSISETTTNDTEDLLNLCNQCNSLCQEGHKCNEQIKNQSNSDKNITTTEKVINYNCSLESLV
ncbi:PREDICTED: zinc finger protein 561-like [Polistes canadensis]|uniref:zinc finger protein 561-like n=1 Tax=Polistes canadensis TaxID=91411 RepID=UPI000718E6A9|nr:PREDICTED: zinc finger protein 561-like [Polistes canadensis]